MLITYTIRGVKYLYNKIRGSETANSSEKSPPKQKCMSCVSEQRAATKYRWTLIGGLFPAFFVSSLDLTIVATALPEIASHFDKFNELNWIVTSMTLTSTAFIPVFGQLADSLGRHTSLQLACILLTVGSILCAAAPSWAVLLLGRALQGIGTAGIQNVSMIALADRVSLKEQAVNSGFFQILNGIAYSVGPVIGGYLTAANWRYCFVLCAGLSAVAMVTIFLIRSLLKPGGISLSRPASHQTRLQALWSGISNLDYGGLVLFISGVALVIIATAWGGSTYAWSSVPVLVTLILGSVLIVACVVYETLLAPGGILAKLLPNVSPMIPASVLRTKDVALVSIIAIGTGAAFYSVFYFIGIYFTLVEAYEADRAGVQLLYYIPGLGGGAYAAILLCNAWPRQTIYPLLIGTTIETAGVAALAYAVWSRNASLVNGMMALAGVGTGLRFMPKDLHLAGMCRDRIASVYSIVRFAVPFGGTLALTIMGSVFTNQLAAEVDRSIIGDASQLTHDTSSLNNIASLPAAEQEAIRAAGANATMWAFISILPLIVLSLGLCLCLGNVWIGRSQKPTEGEGQEMKFLPNGEYVCAVHAEDAMDGVSGDVSRKSAREAVGEVEYVSGVYLLALWRGRVKQSMKKGVLEHGSGEPIRSSEEELMERKRHGTDPNEPSRTRGYNNEADAV